MEGHNTLDEAKNFLRENWKEGVKCPCCGRKVQLYKHSLTSGMARTLIYMNRITEIENPPGGFVKVQEVFAKRYGANATAMGYSLLKWWGLLIMQDNDDPTRRGTGYWCITDKGKRFVHGDLTVPAQVFIYDNKRQGFSEEHVTIKEALGKHFDYLELMGDQLKKTGLKQSTLL